jgi:hypothetical protein
MLLADIAARDGDAASAARLLEAALRFHAGVGDDFEVAVNFRVRPWLEKALRDVAAGHLDAVRAYPFAR